MEKLHQKLAKDFCLDCGLLSKRRCRMCPCVDWYFACHLEVFNEEAFMHA